MKRRNLLKNAVVLSIFSFIFSSIAFLSGILKPFEYKVYDLLSRYVNPAKSYDSICLIYVDQLSIDELSKQGITWPWPRQIYAPVIEYLSEANAVFIDIIFSENSSYGVEDDKILADAIFKAGNVYLPVVLSNEKKAIDEKFLRKISYPNQLPTWHEYNSAVFPIDEFKTVAKGFGNVSILPDEDGVYRRMPLFFKVKEYLVPNFVLSYFIQKNAVNVKNNEISIENKLIPQNDGRLLIKYSSQKNPFPTFSFIELLTVSTQNNKNQRISKEFFKDKTVFVGLTAAGLFDLKPTPVASKTPGVFIHASVFANLANRDFIKPAPKSITFVILILLSSLISYLFLRQHSMKVNLFILVFLVSFLVFMVTVLFRFSIYLQLLPSFTCLIVSSIITLLYSYATEGKQRSFIKRTFSQYMDKKIVDYLLEHPQAIAPGGQKKTVTVFFADIQGFTSISEKLTAEDTAMMLYKVLNSLTEVIIKHSGVIDKYIGDCIMAFWGAPLKTDFDEVNACNAALECIEVLEQVNKQFSESGLPIIKIRIGIHTGDAIVGNIGSDRLFNYTAIGDTVNIASRLEAVNKFFKTNIIVSEETYLKTFDKFIARQLGVIRVKGRVSPLKIFEILGRKADEKPRLHWLADKYNSAYSFFIKQRWNEAKEEFQSILNEFPKDFPSRFYLNKIEEIIHSEQLTEDWIVVKIEEK